MVTSQSNSNINKPCVVEATQGFTVLYNQRYLYSKYNPSKPVINLVNSTQIMEGSLILCYSPLLWYGAEELTSKLPESCHIIAIEADPELYSLTLEHLNKGSFDKSHITLIEISQIQSVAQYLFENPGLLNTCDYRRIIPLDMSGGVFFNKDLYNKTTFILQDYISTFWKNRLTLTKLGRLFSRNIFKNIKNLPSSLSFEQMKKSCSRPVYVFGAGESAQLTLKTTDNKLLQDKCFIIAVDAAIPLLQSYNIRIDGIVAVESQHAIQKAYIGYAAKNRETILFADMTSREHIARYTPHKKCYFTSDYAHLTYLQTLKDNNILPPLLPPMGSVGLTAVYIALEIRKTDDIPVFFTGLDFSYSTGKTHSNGTHAHINSLIKTDRTHSIENYGASYKKDAASFSGKNSIRMTTDRALENYSKLFTYSFNSVKNLYDTGFTGKAIIKNMTGSGTVSSFLNGLEDVPLSVNQKIFAEDTHIIKDFIQNELNELLCVRNVLSGKESPHTDIKELLKNKDYLYAHFPDGYKWQENLSFYKRIRSEIDFYIKDLTITLNKIR